MSILLHSRAVVKLVAKSARRLAVRLARRYEGLVPAPAPLSTNEPIEALRCYLQEGLVPAPAPLSTDEAMEALRCYLQEGLVPAPALVPSYEASGLTLLVCAAFSY